MPERQLIPDPSQLQDVRDVLMFRIARLATIGDRTGQSRLLREFGLSLGEWRVLGVICARPPATLADIAGELYLDKGQLSRTISILIDNGLVAHGPSAHDRRQTLFQPTAKGRRLHDKVLKFAFTRHSEWMGALTASEQSEFIRLLDKVTAVAAQSYDNLFAPQSRQGAELENPIVRQRPARKIGAPGARAGVRKSAARTSGEAVDSPT